MESTASENGSVDTPVKVRRKPGPKPKCKTTNPTSFDCPNCDAKFPSKDLADSHAAVHNNDAYECGQCDKLFSNFEDLKTHFIALHTVQGTCTTILGLEILQESHNNATTSTSASQDNSYVCEYCSKVCANKSAYDSHVRTHSNEREFKCDSCPKSYKNPHELTIHKRTHTNERPFACPEPGCGKSFTIRRSMLDHQRRHTKAFRYYCEVSGCGKGFITKQDRDRHEVRGHIPVEERPELPGEKTQCQVCKKWISQKGQMKEHLRTHSKEAPFVCHICGKGFKIKSNLNVHLKSKKHTGEPVIQRGRGKKAVAKAKAKKKQETDSDYELDEEEDEQEDLKPTPPVEPPQPSVSLPQAHFPMYVHSSPSKIVHTIQNQANSNQHVYQNMPALMPQFNQVPAFVHQVQPNLQLPVLTLHDPFQTFQ
ncbi:putative zinc finger protein [Orchesella cincta]|uniref:Putative zinc finger protein n=1 Tax=Orchesella cincta TaxID=48709 RepID=A0A1D2N8M6_ORCCI|nr:putative zinc finger protein [Orchesella cincta]